MDRWLMLGSLCQVVRFWSSKIKKNREEKEKDISYSANQ